MSDSPSPKISPTRMPALRSVLHPEKFVRTKIVIGALVVAVIVFVVAGTFDPRTASTAGATPPVGLGSAAPFAVLAGTTITNTGPTVIRGDLGLYPGTAITGFPPGIQATGVTDDTDAVASLAKNDATTAFLDAAGRTPDTVVGPDLGGQTLVPGVYSGSSSMAITGTLTLDAQGDPNAVFIFQAGSTLITASNSVVALENGAQACNIFWEVGSSLTLGTTSSFSGTVFSLTSSTLNTGATVAGRIIALNGAVTLDDNLITVPTCAAVLPTTTTTVAATTTSTAVGGTTTSTAGGTTTTTTGGSTSTSIVVGAVTTTTSTPGGTTTTALGSGTTPTTGSGGSPSTIPLGAPQTGLGGTVGLGVWPDLFIALGAFIVAAFAGLFLFEVRRRNQDMSSGPRDSSRET